MLKQISFTFLLFIAVNAISQIYPTQKELEAVKDRKLLVIKLSSEGMNESTAKEVVQLNKDMEDIVSTAWTFTKGTPTFIQPEEANAFLAKNNAQNFFVIDYKVFEIFSQQHTLGKFKSSENYIAKMMFYKGELFEKIKTLKKPSDFFPFTVYLVDMAELIPDYSTLRGVILGTQVMFIDASKEKINWLAYSKKQTSQNSPLAKTKKLLIPKEQLPEGTEASEISNMYPYPIQLVTDDEYRSTLQQKSPDALYIYGIVVPDPTSSLERGNYMVIYVLADCATNRVLAYTNPVGRGYKKAKGKDSYNIAALQDIAAKLNASLK